MVMVEADKVFAQNAEHLLESIERVRYATMKPTTNTKPFNTCVQFKGQRVFSLDGYHGLGDTQEGVTSSRCRFCAMEVLLAYLKVFGKSGSNSAGRNPLGAVYRRRSKAFVCPEDRA